MNLKQAQRKNKLAQFIKEREKEAPANRKRFNRLLKSMASKTAKAKRETSASGSNDG
jgi:hypothetical protein